VNGRAGACAGTPSMAVSRETIYAHGAKSFTVTLRASSRSSLNLRLLLSRNDTRVRPGTVPGTGSTTCSSDLACRAVPCHVVMGAEGVSLLFMSTFWGRYVAARGITCFFWTLLCRLHQPRGRVPDGAQEVHQRYCCRADTAAPILPRRYCRADTACRHSLPTQPAEAACWGHPWQVCCIGGIPCDTLRCRGIPCDTLGYLVRHPRALGCLWVVCIDPAQLLAAPAFACYACYACLLEP